MDSALLLLKLSSSGLGICGYWCFEFIAQRSLGSALSGPLIKLLSSKITSLNYLYYSSGSFNTKIKAYFARYFSFSRFGRGEMERNENNNKVTQPRGAPKKCKQICAPFCRNTNHIDAVVAVGWGLLWLLREVCDLDSLNAKDAGEGRIMCFLSNPSNRLLDFEEDGLDNCPPGLMMTGEP